MKFLLTFILSFFTLAGFAQKRDVYFYKNNNTRVDLLDSADFIRVVSEPDSGSTLYNVTELYKDNKKKRQGKSSHIEYFIPEGNVVTYYQNGKRKAIENYSNGNLTGDYYEYFPNGKLRTIRYYDPNKSEYDKKDAGGVYRYEIITHYDSAGKALVVEKNGYYIGADSIEVTPVTRYITEEGPIKNGKRNGNWKGSEPIAKVTFTEVYENGDLVSGISTDSAGNTYQYNKNRLMTPEYLGGTNSFSKYLVRTIRYPAEARNRNIQGRVFLTFIVKKDGEIKNVRILRTPDESLGAEALRVMKISPKWKPALYFGVPADIIYNIPIAFNLAYE